MFLPISVQGIKRSYEEVSDTLNLPNAKRIKTNNSLLATSIYRSVRIASNESSSLSLSKWNEIRKKTHLLCHQFRPGCKIMHPTYWKEVFPVTVASLQLHIYPNKKWEKEWGKNDHPITYQNYVAKQLLLKEFSLAKINVLYFSDQELNHFRVNIDQNKLYKDGKLLANKNYIFVLDPEDKLFIGQKFETPCGKIQHSSFTRGGPIKSAGWIQFDTEGNVIEIANFSGHYRPGSQQVRNIIDYFNDKQVNLSRLSIVFSPEGIAKNFKKYPVKEWLEKFI